MVIAVPLEMANDAVESGGTQPLLSSSKARSDDADEDEQEGNDDDDDDSDKIQKPVTSVMSAYKLLTPSVKVKYITLLQIPTTMVLSDC